MTAGASPHPPVREDWLALRQEEILDPGQPIVDPHHHLWDRPEGRYLFPELLADLAAGHDVRATVYVQCRSMYRVVGAEELRPVGEVEFANGVAAQAASGLYGRRHACAGIVGYADLTLGERVAPVLEALKRAEGDRLRGVRHPVAWHQDDRVRSNPVPPPPGLLRHSGFRAGVGTLQRYALSLDIWAYHTQLGDVLDLAREHPGTTIVLDHLGGPLGVGPYAGRRDESFSAWRQSLAQLARLSNLRLKIGGLGMQVSGFAFHEQLAPPSSEELCTAWRLYVATAIQLFGVERCMFESNFPIDKGMSSYAVLWNAFKRLAAACSVPERQALFFDTAVNTYKLDKALLQAPEA